MLHGLHTVRGTSTAYLESKPLLKLLVMRQEILYEVFLDLHKVYGALYCDRCLNILGAYGVGSWDIRLL